jgi:SET domain-containing protein
VFDVAKSDFYFPQDGEMVYDIRDSAIHGRGVFATLDVSRKTVVGEYDGKRRPLTYEGSLAYAAQSRSHLIDANDPLFRLGHFINHDTTNNNVRLVDVYGDNRLFVVATRRVRRGEEFLLKYDRGYDWTSAAPTVRTRSGRSVKPVVKPFFVCVL